MDMFILGGCVGIIVKTLVAMPWLDDPVRRGWAWAWSKISS